MISRYNGTCAYCKKPTRGGVDHYSMEEKISFHFVCRTSTAEPDPPTASTEADALADKLGFK